MQQTCQLAACKQSPVLCKVRRQTGSQQDDLHIRIGDAGLLNAGGEHTIAAHYDVGKRFCLNGFAEQNPCLLAPSSSPGRYIHVD